jgi:hypothetical protein
MSVRHATQVGEAKDRMELPRPVLSLDSDHLALPWMTGPVKLCADCDRAARDAKLSNTIHLTHPERGAPMVCNTWGEVICPSCGARWRRAHNDAVLVPRKPLRRVTNRV